MWDRMEVTQAGGFTGEEEEREAVMCGLNQASPESSGSSGCLASKRHSINIG